MSIRNLFLVASPYKVSYKADRSLSKTRRIRGLLTVATSFFAAGMLFMGMQVLALFASQRSVTYASELVTSMTFDSIQLEIASRREPIIVTKINDADKAAVQEVVDEWAQKYRGLGSVYILDTETGEVLAASTETKQYFTASMYKLYVAYLALQDIDSGLHDGNAVYLSGRTRLDCIYAMIQESNSPCAERMMGEITRQAMNQRLAVLGMTHTDIVSLKTTAKDAAIISRAIALGDGLSEQSQQFIQKAMREQKFRYGLPTGFDRAVVEDKVGYNKHVYGWHDAGNVKLASNTRVYTVSVFSEHIGTAGPAALAKSLQPVLEAIVPLRIEQ